MVWGKDRSPSLDSREEALAFPFCPQLWSRLLPSEAAGGWRMFSALKTVVFNTREMGLWRGQRIPPVVRSCWKSQNNSLGPVCPRKLFQLRGD